MLHVHEARVGLRMEGQEREIAFPDIDLRRGISIYNFVFFRAFVHADFHGLDIKIEQRNNCPLYVLREYISWSLV